MKTKTPLKTKMKISNISLLIAITMLIVMYLAGAGVYDRFGQISTIMNLFNDNAYLIVVAVGMTFVLLTGGIDISVASTLAFTGVFSAFLLEKGWPALVVIPLVLLIGTFVGFAQGYAVHTFQIAPFLVTLAGQFLMRGMCAVISTVSIPINNGFYKAAALGKISWKMSSGGTTKLYYYVFVALAVLLIAWYVLKYTRFGRAVYAVGSNEQSAQYMGLPVSAVKIGVYAISGFCAALGGVLFSFYTLAGYSLQNMGLELDAISSAVIGGTLLTGGVGTVIGSMVGVLIQGIIQTIVTYQNLNTWWTKVTIAAILCFFILIQRVIAIRAEKKKACQQLINRVSIGEEGFLFVVDDSDVVYTPSSNVVYRVDQESYKRAGVDTDRVKIHDTAYFIANQYSGYSGWRVVGVIPETEFSAGIRPVYQALSLCIAVCLLLVVLVSIGVSDTVTRPILKLSGLMAKAEEGDFSVRFEAMHQDEIGVLGTSFNHMLEHIGELIHELYEEKQIRLEAQLKSLQEQIKPHFLYNTLDTISWMARAQNAMDVVRLVDALTNMFRVGLSSGRDYITLREEKNHVTNYLYIQKVRYQDRLRYSIEIPDAYDGLVVPKLILQPLVENAIYHGVKMKRSGGQIRVTAQTEGEVLLLYVWDDGAGISLERLEELRQGQSRSKEEKTGGFGLSYIAERIKLSYGNPYGIQIDSQEGIFTQITVRLPVQEEGFHV